MEHSVIYRDPDAYSPWPVLWPLPDGSIGAGVVTSPIGSHPGASTFGRFFAMASCDGGRTWQPSDHPAHPANWPFGTEDEHMDRFAAVLPDPGGDTFVTVGAHGFEAWDAGRLDEARSQHRWVRMLPERPGHIAVQSPLLVSRRSTDGGKTWEVREWDVPGVQGLWCFNRGVVMHDGTLVVSVYAHDHDGDERAYVLRSEDTGRTWRLHDLCAKAKVVPANETALCEVSPGRLIALTRSDLGRGDHHLLQLWSDDGGRTWTEPIKTPIWGHPAHLLKLADGRILCTHGYRRTPLGVRTVFSEDSGETWDVAGTVVLRGDSSGHSPHRGEGTGVGDVGYPVSMQLPDGAVLTAYYLTPDDNVTHCAATRWQPDGY